MKLKKERIFHFNFDAFFRVRNEKTMKPEDFRMSSEAGIKRIRIGVESGSREVRLHIGKTETNDDIFYTLTMCKKYGIAVNILILVGYVNESEKNFNETLDFLREVRNRDLDLTVDTVVVNELYISQGTKLSGMIDELNIKDYGSEASEKNERQWNRRLSNGEVIDSEVRNKRVAKVKEYVKYNFRAIGKVIVSSKDEESCEFKREWDALKKAE